MILIQLPAICLEKSFIFAWKRYLRLPPLSSKFDFFSSFANQVRVLQASPQPIRTMVHKLPENQLKGELISITLTYKQLILGLTSFFAFMAPNLAGHKPSGLTLACPISLGTRQRLALKFYCMAVNEYYDSKNWTLTTTCPASEGNKICYWIGFESKAMEETKPNLFERTDTSFSFRFRFNSMILHSFVFCIYHANNQPMDELTNHIIL